MSIETVELLDDTVHLVQLIREEIQSTTEILKQKDDELVQQLKRLRRRIKNLGGWTCADCGYNSKQKKRFDECDPVLQPKTTEPQVTEEPKTNGTRQSGIPIDFEDYKIIKIQKKYKPPEFSKPSEKLNTKTCYLCGEEEETAQFRNLHMRDLHHARAYSSYDGKNQIMERGVTCLKCGIKVKLKHIKTFRDHPCDPNRLENRKTAKVNI